MSPLHPFTWDETMSRIVELKPEHVGMLRVGTAIVHRGGSLWEIVACDGPRLKTRCVERAEFQPHELIIDVDDPEIFRNVFIDPEDLPPSA